MNNISPYGNVNQNHNKGLGEGKRGMNKQSGIFRAVKPYGMTLQ